MKSNPLFFDSTKFRGDIVIVDIELSGVELNEGETLWAHVMRNDGSEALVQMISVGVTNQPIKWTAQSRLEYLQRAKVEFLIKSGEELVEHSEIFVITASYTIPLTWDRAVLAPQDDKVEELSPNDTEEISVELRVGEDVGTAINTNTATEFVVEEQLPTASIEIEATQFENTNLVKPDFKDLE